MNTELMSLVISLLGSLPVSQPPAATPPAAVYATWASSQTATYRCPDPGSGIDPMGEPTVISKTRMVCDATGCQSETRQQAVLLVPESKTCTKTYLARAEQVFPSAGAAERYRKDCQEGQCLNWSERPATEHEIVQEAISEKHWSIDHFPGGDAFRYPAGIYEIYPAGARSEEPLGTGNSEIAAVADALQKTL